MTEKRFTHKEDDWEILDNGKHLAYAHSGYQADKICELLNEQHKEIEHLKAVIKDVEYQRDYVHPKYDGCRKCVKELFEENEQLKSTMKEVAELLEEEVDLFSDKATEYDICAYVELQELDNKDAYYMATSTKKAIKMLKEL